MAAATGIALRQSDQQPGSFFRASIANRADLPTPGATPGVAVINDPGNRMLRPLPLSPAEPWVSAAEQQLRGRNLTAPAGGNAYDSLLTAWKTDAGHERLPTVTAALLNAFGDEAERRLRAGDDRRARDYMQRAEQLATRAGPGSGDAMERLRSRIVKALDTRIDQAAKKFDHAAALRVVDSAREFGLDSATIASLSARARKIPKSGEAVDTNGNRLARVGDRMIVAGDSDISRADYARFASATGRPAALCRERVSLLRVLKPRSWQSPGFEQSPQHPVVCVSWSDAQAYAHWLSQRSGQRYRLPTASEAHVLPGTGGAKPVAEWLSDCDSNCRQRLSVGKSWRGASGMRPLDAGRGYDDVGFRLVRDP